MKIYTGYWARLHRYLAYDLQPVRISGLMKWMGEPYTKYPCLEYLRPTWEMVKTFHAFHKVDEYTEKYNKILENAPQNKILEDLIRISHENGGKNVILLCYETPTEFCHRQLVAKHLNQVLNKENKVTEFKA